MPPYIPGEDPTRISILTQNTALYDISEFEAPEEWLNEPKIQNVEKYLLDKAAGKVANMGNPSSKSKSSPVHKRNERGSPSKVLGDFHITRINQVFENF